MGMKLLFHDECGEFLDMDGGCPRCGFRPEEQSVGSRELPPERVRECVLANRTFLTFGGAQISGWTD